MSDEIRLILRVGLAGVGLWYLVSVLRRRRLGNHEVVGSGPAPRTAAPSSGNPSKTSARDPLVLAAWWESVRTWSTRIAIGLFALMGVLLALAAPVSIIEAVLIGMGISMAVYLVASLASGWYEGRSQL